MEAKVDVRKLQVLNDRINQTIDALNQVRLSVHGLGHTGVTPQMNPLAYLTQGFGTQGLAGQGFGGQSGGQGFGQPGFGAQGFGGGFPQTTPWAQGMGGLGHTSPFQQVDPLSQGNPLQQSNPFQQGNPLQQGNPFQQTNPFQQGNPFSQINPMTQGLQHSPYAQGNPYGNVPGLQSPYGVQGIGRQGYVQDIVDQKLAEIRASDPYRITQTFPFATM